MSCPDDPPPRHPFIFMTGMGTFLAVPLYSQYHSRCLSMKVQKQYQKQEKVET